MSTFAQLKKSNDNLSRLLTEVDKVNTPQKSNNSNQDERFWRPELDKSGNGYAVIRFLPESEGEELPWVRIFNHGFQGPTGKWYIENSLTTLNQKDPVAEHNSVLWNSGTEANKDIARKQKRRLSYIANVLVVSDPKHPENEGQVKLFKFGKKIFDKIMDQMKPQFEDESPINPFDPWKGTNFKLKIRKVDGFWNYDKSEFEAPTPVADNDDTIKDIWGKQYPLKPFLETSNFKSYDDLREKFNRVIAGSKNTETASEIDLPPTTSSPAPVKQAAVGQVNEASKSVDDDDDTLSYFSKLAEDE
mgnify:CR=1 FL=1